MIPVIKKKVVQQHEKVTAMLKEFKKDDKNKDSSKIPETEQNLKEVEKFLDNIMN